VCGIAPSVTLVSGPQSRANFEAVHRLNALGRGVDVAYNWGLFDFAQPGFVPRLMTGQMMYWMAGFDADRTVRGWAYFLPEVETVHYKVGTANIDVVDAKRKQLVWEGVAEARLTNKMLENPGPAIDGVVAEMFLEYPARAGSAAVAPAKK